MSMVLAGMNPSHPGWRESVGGHVELTDSHHPGELQDRNTKSTEPKLSLPGGRADPVHTHLGLFTRQNASPNSFKTCQNNPWSENQEQMEGQTDFSHKTQDGRRPARRPGWLEPPGVPQAGVVSAQFFHLCAKNPERAGHVCAEQGQGTSFTTNLLPVIRDAEIQTIWREQEGLHPEAKIPS